MYLTPILKELLIHHLFWPKSPFSQILRVSLWPAFVTSWKSTIEERTATALCWPPTPSALLRFTLTAATPHWAHRNTSMGLHMSEKRVEKSSGENTWPEVSPRAPGLFWAVQKNHLKPPVYTFWRCPLINGPSRKRDQKTEGFCEEGMARAAEGTAVGLMRQAGMSCRRKRPTECVLDSEEDSRINYPISHRDSIASSSVLLSSFFFPSPTTAICWWANLI